MTAHNVPSDQGPDPALIAEYVAKAPVKRVLVCGSRKLSEEDRSKVYFALEYLWRLNPLVVIHGGAKGADSMAKDWALKMGCEQAPFPADWAKYGRKAGPIRNQQMLDEGKPDIVLAFPDKDSVGTWDMVKRAQAAGLEVLVQTGVGLARIDGSSPAIGVDTPEKSRGES